MTSPARSRRRPRSAEQRPQIVEITTPAGPLFAYTGGKAFDRRLPTVVLVHGAQHDHSVWILQSRYLAHHGFGVLAFDLPGHGRSSAPLADSVPQFADALLAGLDAAGVETALIAGHSMGSLIAIELAARLGPRCAGVALLATAAPMRVADTLLAATRDEPARAMDLINAWSHSPSLAPHLVRPGAPGPGFSIYWQNLRLMQHIARLNGAQVLVNDFAACNAYDGALAAAAALRCPALFILGAADQMTPPKAARALIEVCADATVVQLPATGHAMMAEHPDGVRSALIDFARRVLPQAQRAA
jgi:pimeloyl-ACP methyl ester carboxylesterase